MENPQRDELFERLRQPAQDRDSDEENQCADEDATGPETVTEPPGGRDDRREAEQVADRDPLDFGALHAELVGQRR